MQQDPQDLRPLLAGVARGDRLAFKGLYERTSPRLYGVVLRILGDRGSAEEVLQDTYLQIWRRASSYEAAAGAPLAWMNAIARHRAIDVLRQRGGRPATLAGDDGGAVLERLAAPSETLDLADRDELRRCLARLDEDHSRCIVLAYCDGYSREELAGIYDRPVNTIKTWLHRGLAALRRCLEAS